MKSIKSMETVVAVVCITSMIIIIMIHWLHHRRLPEECIKSSKETNSLQVNLLRNQRDSPNQRIRCQTRNQCSRRAAESAITVTVAATIAHQCYFNLPEAKIVLLARQKHRQRRIIIKSSFPRLQLLPRRRVLWREANRNDRYRMIEASKLFIWKISMRAY